MSMNRHMAGHDLPLDRCPHCSIMHPRLIAHNPPFNTPRADGGPNNIWLVFSCASCGSLVTAKCSKNSDGSVRIFNTYPDAGVVSSDLPPAAAKYLKQAHETAFAPDAAAVMAGSAVDAMLKALRYENGSVYSRIEQAEADHVLTKGMAEWAHSVRLGSNRPRHADSDSPHVSEQEARNSIAFADALGQFLFVLAARIDRGIEEANSAAS